MAEHFRIPAKFNAHDQTKYTRYTTNSNIKITNQHPTKVTWKRRYGDIIEILSHLDNQIFYQCSQLDAGYIIEATIDCNQVSSSSQTLIQSFGPIQKYQKDSFTTLNQFSCEIRTNNKTYPCLLILNNDQIQLKPKSSMKLTYPISIQDISTCYTINKTTRTIIFPTLYQRIIGLKLFNQILLSGGNYSQNNDVLKLIIANQYQFRLILMKLNGFKLSEHRKMSQINIRMSKKTKPSMISTQQKKSVSDLKRDSQDSFQFGNNSKSIYHTNNTYNNNTNNNNNNNKTKVFSPIRNLNLKASQLVIHKPKVSLAPSDGDCTGSLQQQVNYFTEFQDLIYSNQHKNQALALNSSFQELQLNNNGSEKDLQKLEFIRRKKQNQKSLKSLKSLNQTQKLKQKLDAVLKEKKKLNDQNYKLKSQLNKLSVPQQEINDYNELQNLKHVKIQLQRELRQLEMIGNMRNKGNTDNKIRNNNGNCNQYKNLVKYKSLKHIVYE